jgi:hypothetical protein
MTSEYFCRVRMERLLVILLTLKPMLGLCQYSYTISGYVHDKKTGEALMGVRVFIEGWRVESYTNRYGYFNISSPPQDIVLSINQSGYRALRDSFSIENDRFLNIFLEQEEHEDYDHNDLPRSQNEVTDVLGNKIDLPMKFTREIPYMFGETDLIKGLQNLPGVKFGNEGFSNLFVRGGGTDQNLMLIDGIPVYYNSHLGGMFSVYNPEAINNVQLHKGGFAPHYGGRLSSVIDITTIEGNSNKSHGSVSLTPLSIKLALTGGSKDTATTYSFGLRMSYFDFFLKGLLTNLLGLSAVKYADLNFKMVHKIDKRDKIYFSGYLGRDRLVFNNTIFDSSQMSNIRSDANIGWGNLAGSIRWNHIYGMKLFGSVSLMFSQYGVKQAYTERISDSTSSVGNYTSDYKSGIRDVLLHADFEFNKSATHFLRYGLQASFRGFNTGYLRQEGKNIPSTDNFVNEYGNKKYLQSNEMAFYLEDDIASNDRWKINLGLRAVVYLTEGFQKVYPEPRINMRYRVSDVLSFKASAGRMNQFMHLLTNSGSGSPYIYWAPATEKVKPEYADQVTIGMVRVLNDKFQLSVDAYYKKMNNLVALDNSFSSSDVKQDWQKLVNQGTGDAYGLEMLIKRKAGSFTGWLGYSFSKATRTFETINLGNPFPFNFDRRHQVNLLFQFWVNDVTSASINFVLGSGNPFTLPVGKYLDIDGRQVLDYGSINNYRAPRYSRFDLGINNHFGELSDGISHELYFSVYNMFFKRNPSIVYAIDEFNQQGNLVYSAYQVSFFFFIPGVYYVIKF